ncbi:hypothetical protein DUI87_28576 [Hirundo rustica rustica]|uniref:Uncharacterized protein n=1 Tax=Hirundo rustica rustica TaxID=333673 RepID=A0A3M0J243_HIRRU|nr:hypothetical protein DUI87_28576 [Hirundo rustica rustica]
MDSEQNSQLLGSGSEIPADSNLKSQLLGAKSQILEDSGQNSQLLGPGSQIPAGSSGRSGRRRKNPAGNTRRNPKIWNSGQESPGKEEENSGILPKRSREASITWEDFGESQAALEKSGNPSENSGNPRIPSGNPQIPLENSGNPWVLSGNPQIPLENPQIPSENSGNPQIPGEIPPELAAVPEFPDSLGLPDSPDSPFPLPQLAGSWPGCGSRSGRPPLGAAIATIATIGARRHALTLQATADARLPLERGIPAAGNGAEALGALPTPPAPAGAGMRWEFRNSGGNSGSSGGKLANSGSFAGDLGNFVGNSRHLA